ncbi:MAG: MATE family efflux transporter, partial [Oscillospiraceae bacterium]
FVSVGNLFIQALINSFGVDAVAGYSAAVRLNTFVITSFTTVGNSISNFVAQNHGADQPDRVRKSYKLGLLLTLAIALPVIALFLLLPEPLIGLFMDGSKGDISAALKIGTDFLRIVSPFYVLICTKLVADGVLRGVGAMAPFMVSTFSDLILRVILAYLLTVPLGLTGIWISWPIGWAAAALLSRIFYTRLPWLKPRQ